jgi:tRNA/tmRNA/rRNA uracil-C5-methylase (TrmA/RlmC/RlmD family)
MNNPFDCPHFGTCSGCEIGTLHPPIWQDVQAFLGPLHPTLHIDGFSQTRLKAKLAVRPGPSIGLYKKNSHTVLPIPNCLVHHEAINRAAAYLSEQMIQTSLSAYNENPPTGLLRYMQFFVQRETQKVQLVLVVNAAHSTPELNQFCENIQQADFWHSIWLNFHPEASNRILSDSWHLVSGETYLYQTLNHIPLAFHPGAFSQSHLSLFEKMMQRIESWVYPNEKIIEFYAGVGAISIPLSKKTPHIQLVENNPYAFLSYQEMGYPFPYHAANAQEKSHLIKDSQLIIVDPPRKGLDEKILSSLCEQNKKRLIYVSCGFSSFKKDAAKLLNSGWTLKEADGYLLLPGTNHVELLTLFEKM